MTIPKGTDLGASFERLKKAMNEAEEMRTENGVEGLIDAYARLLPNVEYFIKTFDDAPNPDDLKDLDVFTQHQKP